MMTSDIALNDLEDPDLDRETDAPVAQHPTGAFAEVCAVVPFWSQSDAMNWDSNFSYLRRVLPRLSKLLPGWLFLVFWPQRSKGLDSWRYLDDGLFSDRILPFPWGYDTSMRASTISYDAERYQELELRFAPTMIWLHQVEMGTFLTGGYKQSYNRSGRPIMVAQHHYVIHKSLPYPFMGLFPRFWLQVGGSIASQKVVLNSDYTRAMFKESLDEWVHPNIARDVLAKSQVLRFAPVEPEMVDLPIRSHDHPVVVYNHRFENYKNWKTTGEVLASLRRGGVDFEVWATQHVDQHLGEFPADRLVGAARQMDYLRNIAVPGINTINSQHETFCLAMMDSIALGQLPVAPLGVTFPELVPEGYPFLFKDQAEQRRMLYHILSTWPKEYDRWSPILRAHARESFAIDRYVRDYAEILSHAGVTWQQALAKPHVRASFSRFFNRLPPGTYELGKVARQLKNALGLQDQACPNRRIVREFARVGAQIVSPDRRSLGIIWPGADADRIAAVYQIKQESVR